VQKVSHDLGNFAVPGTPRTPHHWSAVFDMLKLEAGSDQKIQPKT